MRWPKAGSPRAASRPRRRPRAKFSRSCRATMRRRCRIMFANLLMRQGLQRFVLETLTSLNHAVGDAWMRGELAVFEEHLYTEQLQVALRTGHQRVSAAAGRAAGADHDVPRRAARPRPADGRGVARAGRRAMHFARRADADRGHPARGARARGPGRRVVVLRRPFRCGRRATGSRRCAGSCRQGSRSGQAAR